MNKMRLIALTALAAVFLYSAAGLAATESAAGPKNGWPNHLRLLTGPNGGQWFMLGEPIAEVLSKQVLLTSSRMGGGVANIDSINKKSGDIGFTLACFMGAASSGEAEYQNIRLDNAVIMANVYPQVFYFLVRKDVAEKYGITSVKDILQIKAPLHFASLRPGTASEFILTLLLKYGYDTGFEKLRQQGWNVSFNNYAEAADNFVSGELDCFAYTAGTDVPLIKTMEDHTGVVVLPVDKEVLDLLSAKFKTGSYTIEPGDYKSVQKPILTLGDYTTLVVRKDLPEDLVYAINKALFENRRYIANVIVDFGGLSVQTALPAGLPTHPGSIKYWTEQGAPGTGK